jgi:hypothetical protein
MNTTKWHETADRQLFTRSLASESWAATGSFEKRLRLLVHSNALIQFLFSLVTKLSDPALRLAILLPDLIGTMNDLFLRKFAISFAFPKLNPPAMNGERAVLERENSSG